ncbi:MAG: amidohydrolase family protein [Clostridia bacterium]|nr:amidohydrolase family protein [Clostridia bacterium]
MLVLKNGRIVDPSQQLDKVTNLYIENGKIAHIGDDFELDDDAKIVDVSGKIVSPGFIDIHMHEDYINDEGKLQDSISMSALKMGVTLDVGGNCGDNNTDPLVLFDIADKGVPTNIALFVGHTTLRSSFGKADKYKAIDAEKIKKITEKADEYLQKGCIGVSFGVKYVPGTTWEEILPLIKLCHKYNKLVSSHVRQDVDGVFDSCAELAKMGKEGDVKVQFSHIGSMGGYGQMEELLKQIEGYRTEGIDMMCDCYPYTAFSTGIGETTYDDGFLDRYQADYDSVMIASGPYAGTRCDKELFEKIRKEEPHTMTVGYFMKAEDIEMALKSDLVMIGSDGTRGRDGKGHPRASGSFARFIEEYINTGKIPLMDGIAKMSTMAAERLGLDSKGSLKVGKDGDVTVFDLENTKDNADYHNSLLAPSGIEYVIINGEIALEHGEVVNAHLGRSVRKF